jgi:hypothetical protein
VLEGCKELLKAVRTNLPGVMIVNSMDDIAKSKNNQKLKKSKRIK